MGIQYAGGTNVHTTFAGVVKNDLLTNILSNLLSAGWTKVSGVAPSTVTMTIANPCVVSLTAHGFADGTRVVFSTTSALPTGIVASTVYFVKSPATDTFNVSATITTTGSQSGAHVVSASARKWIRWVDDNVSTWTAYTSLTGFNWQSMFSHARNTTIVPTQGVSG